MEEKAHGVTERVAEQARGCQSHLLVIQKSPAEIVLLSPVCKSRSLHMKAGNARVLAGMPSVESVILSTHASSSSAFEPEEHEEMH